MTSHCKRSTGRSNNIDYDSRPAIKNIIGFTFNICHVKMSARQKLYSTSVSLQIFASGHVLPHCSGTGINNTLLYALPKGNTYSKSSVDISSPCLDLPNLKWLKSTMKQHVGLFLGRYFLVTLVNKINYTWIPLSAFISGSWYCALWLAFTPEHLIT